MALWPRNRRRHPLDRQRGFIMAPAAVIFEDRSTGTQYLLSHDSDTDSIVLTTPVPRQANAIVREPLVFTDFGPRRLFVEDGVLDDEPALDRFSGRQDASVFTLNFNDRRTTFEIHGEGTSGIDGALCLRKYEGIGRTLTVTDLGCTLDLGITDGSILDTAGRSILDTAGRLILDTTG